MVYIGCPVPSSFSFFDSSILFVHFVLVSSCLILQLNKGALGVTIVNAIQIFFTFFSSAGNLGTILLLILCAIHIFL